MNLVLLAVVLSEGAGVLWAVRPGSRIEGVLGAEDAPVNDGCADAIRAAGGSGSSQL